VSLFSRLLGSLAIVFAFLFVSAPALADKKPKKADTHATADSKAKGGGAKDPHADDSHADDTHANDPHANDPHPADTHDTHANDPHAADTHAADSHDAHANDPHAADTHANDPHAADTHAADPHAALEGADPELDVDLHGAPAASNAPAYGAFLRAALAKARPHVIAKLEAKAAASQAKAMDRLSFGLFLFSLLGIVLAIRPAFLVPKYPGRGKTLFGWGFASAALFFLTVNLFAMVIGLLRGAQGLVGHYTNPQIAIVEAAFDILDHRAEDLATLGPQLIEPTLHKAAQGDASFVVVLLDNLQTIKGDVGVILAIVKAVKGLDWLFALIPVVLTIVAVVTFAMSAKGTLMSIVRLPDTVVQGGEGGAVVKSVLRRVKNELFATLCLIGALLVLTVLGGAALKAAVLPAVESFLGTVFLAALYLQTAKVSSAVLFGSLALAAMVLVLNVGVVLATISGTLGKLHKILQRKFHEGLPLSAHGRFWKRASIAVVIGFLFPLVYDFLSEKGIEKILAHELEAKDPSYTFALVGTPALLVGGFIVFFAACYGAHSLVFLFRYPVQKIAVAAPFQMPAAVPSVEQMPIMIRPTLPMGAVALPTPLPPPTAYVPPVDELAIFDKLVPGPKPSDTDLAKTSVYTRPVDVPPVFQSPKRVLDTSQST
jgi:hypothetical protein